MNSQTSCDVVIVGGGHNGLVAAGLLAKRGQKVIVCEKRPVTGGAAITETPFGPNYKVTALSYVVSLLPPSVIHDLELARFGYKVYPQGPYFAPRPDGGYLQLPDEPHRRYDAAGKDAVALQRWDAWLGGLADVLGPLLSQVPPALGSKRPGDLYQQLKLAWTMRGLNVRGVSDVTRLFTMSIADLLEENFTGDALKGVLSVSGLIGTWAGPRSPGTAYVMAHHKIGDVGEGQLGSWGFPEGGMGGLTTAMRNAATHFGADIRTNADVTSINVTGDRTTGVTLADGTTILAPVVIAACHPKIAFIDLVGDDNLPDDFASDLSHWKSRSGTVKVNFAVDRLPDFACKPGFDPEVHGGTIVMAPSIEYLETAYQQAVSGQAATLPFADICIPSVFDKTLAPEGHHIVSCFTQWAPHTWADNPDPVGLAAYADRVSAMIDGVAPGFASSIVGRQVIGPNEMQETYGLIGGNIFHGELSADQLFHMRPAAGYADFRTPICGLYQAHSATHGGGGVTGIPAIGVVKAIATDRRHRKIKR